VYRASGGVHGAVARLAERTYATIADERRPAARALMLRLVADGEGGTPLRRRAEGDVMQPINIFHRRFAPTVVLALIVLAALGAGAANAQVEPYVPGVTDFPSRLGEVGERAAEARLAQTPQGPSITVAEGGFDWSAGVTGAMAATFLLLGAALAIRTAKRGRVALG
jgi:conflict system STAND superfamily ATPase